MIKLRKSEDRGSFDHGWLKTKHTFSFASYIDPNFMGFRDLRVINEDWIQAGQGFGEHPHENMEIISYVVEGALSHKDSMGNGSTIKPGDVQYMSAGRGVRHSEFNHMEDAATHLLQIWILPNKQGGEPRYAQKTISNEDKREKLCLLVSEEGKGGPIQIYQDINMYGSILDEGQSVQHEFKHNRHGWLQLVKGALELSDGSIITAGDGVQISDEANLGIQSKKNDSEFLLFDLN